MRKGILLDIDGTLVRSNDEHAQAWSDALRRFGYEVSWPEIRSWIGMGGDKILPRVDERLDDRQELGKSIVSLRQKIFLERYVTRLQPQPGARELLELLASHGLRRIAATSAKRDELDAILQAGGIANCIDLATTSDDAPRSKPDADIILSALSKAELHPDEAMYLGDTPYDVTAAHKANLYVIALRCGGWNDEQLSGADAIYESPAAFAQRLDDHAM